MEAMHLSCGWNMVPEPEETGEMVDKMVIDWYAPLCNKQTEVSVQVRHV